MPDRNLIFKYLSKTSGCGKYHSYPNISDRDGWEGLDEELKSNIIKKGEESLAKPWTQLLISDFTIYSKTGDRVTFENKYFPRRRKLNNLIIAECVENKGRFMDEILNGLYLILDETTWCLPCHNSYVRNDPSEILPDPSRPIIDLFDAETGALVAMAEYLLRPAFAKISPYISKRINDTLKQRIFDPYLNEHFWWMGNGLEPMCNWTPWCTQNVLICALTRDEEILSEEIKRTFLEKAAVSCDFFLDEYGIDGCCDEGASYFSHAAVCLSGVLGLMDGALRSSKFEELFKEKILRNMAAYITKMHVDGKYYINFADCSPLPGARTARDFLFGVMVNDKSLMNMACRDLKSADWDEKLVTDEINLMYHILQVFSYKYMMNHHDEPCIPDDVWFDSTGLMISRDGKYVLAAKAGDNGDSHNHNDVGSFTVYKKGKPLIIDLGVGTYTRQTFSPDRYGIWTMQSQFHNVPSFIDCPKEEEEALLDKLGQDSNEDYRGKYIVMQTDGVEFKASDVKCVLDKDELLSGNGKSTLTMEIAGAYSDSSVYSYVRKITHRKNESIVIEDEYVGKKRAIMTLMTELKPEVVEKDGEFILKIGRRGQVKIKGADGLKVQYYPIKDERLKPAWPKGVYRTLILIRPCDHFEMEIV